MGHTICVEDFPITCNKNKVQADYNSRAREERESLSVLGKAIKWHDLPTPCESREAAEDWIRAHDDGWYDQLAVTYYDIHELTSAKRQKLHEQFIDINNKINAMERVLYPKTLSAAFIGCKSCESRLNKDFLLTNKCPVCGQDLRPKTMLNKIKQQKDKLKENLNEENKEINRLRAKAMKNKKTCVRWLVKVEWHN